MGGFENFNEEMPSKETFFSLLTNTNADKEYMHVPKVWERFEMMARKNYQDLHLNCAIMLTDKFGNLEATI